MTSSRKRPLVIALASLLVLSLLAGCGGSGSKSTPAKKVELKAGEKVKVTFWHAMGGKLGESTQALVDEFNKSQDKVQVEALYQGTYDESLQKLKASGPNGPTLIQVYEIGSRFMIDSGLITPMQNFIDADNFNTKNFEQNILSYYTFDGKLNSMPFNTSTPIMYYNKTAFKEAGLDPEKPPTTFEEFHQVAKKLTKKTGNDTRYGAGIAWYGWFYEQFLAVSGTTYVDNENGRKALATKATVDSKEGQDVLNWLKGMIDDGSSINLGRKTSETQAAFQGGRIAMTLDSTSVLATMINGVNGKFEVGTAYLPRPKDAKGGVIIGGASLWVTNLKPEKEQWAAWEFVKWLGSPEIQGKWHTMTGYFPIRKEAYDIQTVKDWHAKLPQFKTAIDQLRASKISPVTQGAVIGVFPQARQTIEGAMENVVLGKATSADALKAANAEITKAIENYNKTVK
ncbi:MAG TPA: ABC transporter substrate-binding protein [Symbiobacteriaceae bacterium]|nr:ABC transporter substrate-binding protein [Symbiobacteriaceae bacterium]